MKGLDITSKSYDYQIKCINVLYIWLLNKNFDKSNKDIIGF